MHLIRFVGTCTRARVVRSASFKIGEGYFKFAVPYLAGYLYGTSSRTCGFILGVSLKSRKLSSEVTV